MSRRRYFCRGVIQLIAGVLFTVNGITEQSTIRVLIGVCFLIIGICNLLAWISLPKA